MALDSDNSAQKELNTYMDSIQGKIDKFINSLQTLWMNVIDANFIKDAIDIGTNLLDLLNKIVEKIGVFGTAFGGLAVGLGRKYFFDKDSKYGASNLLSMLGDISGLKALKNQVADLFKVDVSAQVSKMFQQGSRDYEKYAQVIKSLSTAKHAEILVNSGLAESEQLTILTRNLGSDAAARAAIAEAQLAASYQTVSLSQIAQLANTGALTTEQAGLITTTLGLGAAEGMSVEISKADAIAKLEAAVATGTLSAAEKDAIISSLGLGASTTVAATGFKALATAVWSAIKAIATFLVTNPVGWLILAATAIVGVIAAYNAFGPTHKNFVKQLDEQTEKLEDIRSTIKSLNQELQTTQDRIDELNSKESLSPIEKAELEQLKEYNAELERQLKIEQAREDRELLGQLQTAQKTRDTDKNFKTTAHTYGSGTGDNYQQRQQQTEYVNNYDVALVDLQDAYAELNKAEKELENAIDSGVDSSSNEFKALEKNVENAQKKVDDANTSLEEYYQSFTDTYGEIGYQIIDDNDSEQLQAEKKKWNDFYRQVQEYINQQAFMNGTLNKADILSFTFGQYASDAAEAFKTEIENGLKEGGTVQDIMFDVLNNQEYTNLTGGLLANYGISIADIVGFFTQVANEATSTASKVNVVVSSMDALTSAVDAYKNALETVNSLTSDGQAISEDYYNTLKEQLADITVAEQGFSDAIEEQNGKYIVKNVALLQKLVKQSQKAQKATIEVAKAQARSQYNNIVNQIQSEVLAMRNEYNAYGRVTDATMDNIDAMQDQLTALKQTIKQYTLLELKLSDATNGYREFEKAKELDAELAYGDSMIEMIQALNDGFVSGKVGTEAFQAAVKALVPSSVYEDLDDMEAKMKAIHDYFDKDSLFADYFTIDEDGNLSIAFKNIKWFVDDLQKLGVLTGDDASGFSLSADIGGMDDILAKLKTAEGSAGLTQEALVAMISELSKYDARWSNILEEMMATPLDREIIRATDGVDVATKALEEFWKTGEFNQEEYNKLLTALDEANKKLESAQQNAQNNAQEYNIVQAAISSFRGELKLADGDAQGLVSSLKEVSGLENLGEIVIENGQLKLTKDQIDLILQKLGLIEEPTIMHIQTNYDTIVQQIADINTFITELEQNGVATPITVNGVTITNKEEAKKQLQSLIPQKENIEITYGITETSDEEQKTILESYQELAKNGLEFTVTANITDAKQTIDEINASNPDNKEVVFTANASTASDVIKGIADQLSALPDGVSITIETKEKKTIFETIVEAFTPKSTSSTGSGGGSTSKTRQNAIFATGSDGLKTNERNAVVGELGRELVCDVDRGVYYTVGDNGTEIVNLPKHAIIYNHKQTKELLQTGHTSRGTLTGGLSFARGNAHAWSDGQTSGLYGGYVTPSGDGNAFKDTSEKWQEAAEDWLDASNEIYGAADSLSDAVEEFEDTINWIDVLFNRIDNILAEHEAYLATLVDSTGSLSKKDSIFDAIIDTLYYKASKSQESASYYKQKAESIMSGLSTDIVQKIKNGAIDIQEFKFTESTEGLSDTEKKAVEARREAFEKYVAKIQEAIDYYDQYSQYTQEYYSTIEEIADKALEKHEEIVQSYENELSLIEHINDALEARNDLEEAREGFATEAYYKAQIDANNIMLAQYKARRDALQKSLDEAVKLGNIQIGSQQWFDMLQAIYECDDAIIDMEISIEELQNSINDLHWDRFDELINRFGYLEDEISNVIQLLSHDPDGLVMKELYDLTSDNWATGSGLATIGLYAQEMERAQYVANQYAEAIEELKKDYANGRYNETEYLNKLNELISAQYENIEKYHDAKNAIIELNEARVDAIRDGIEKEIDAYSDLIDKKKELLDRERDLHDFNDEIEEKEKDVANIRKQLAAMDGDTSAATVAKKKKLEEELVNAQKALEDSYYQHSMSSRQEALDQELASFEEEKNKEIEKWEEWLKDTEAVIAEALEYVKDNTTDVFETLTGLGEQYGLTMSTELTTPWKNGELAIDSYSDNFETATSVFTSLLDEIVLHWEDVTAAAEEAARAQANALQQEYKNTVSQVPSTIQPNTSTQTTPSKTEKEQAIEEGWIDPNDKPEAKKEIKVGGKINAGSATIYSDSYGGGGGKQYYHNDPIYTVLQELRGYLLVRHHSLSSGYTGWFKKSDVKAYAKGLSKANKDQWALINELGAELQLVPGKNGNLEYIKYGTSIIPHDISEKLINFAKEPTYSFDDMKPNMPSPRVETKNFDFNLSFDSLLHVDNVTQDVIPDLKKMIRGEFNEMMSQVNNKIKRV